MTDAQCPIASPCHRVHPRTVEPLCCDFIWGKRKNLVQNILQPSQVAKALRNFLKIFLQLYAIFRTQQCSQKEHSAKTLRSSLFADFFEVLRLLPWCQSEEMKILVTNSSFPRVGIESTVEYFFCMFLTICQKVSLYKNYV